MRQTIARHVTLGSGLAVLLGVVWATAIFAFVRTAGTLASDVRTALPVDLPQPNAEGGLDLIHVCFGPVSDIVAGEELALAAFFLGGIPVALIGLVSAWRARLTHATFRVLWGRVFHAALIFQLGSLLLGLLLVVALVVDTSQGFSGEDMPFAVVCSLHVCWTAVGVISWRKLQQRAEPPVAASVIIHR